MLLNITQYLKTWEKKTSTLFLTLVPKMEHSTMKNVERSHIAGLIGNVFI